MKPNKSWAFGALALAVLGLGIWASQNIVVRNLIHLVGYERKLDTYSQTDTTVTTVSAQKDAQGREATLISAFFGLDNGLPNLFSWVACRGASEMDGMPIIFSHEIDIGTLEPGDLKITSTSGKVGQVVCLTMAPADDRGELRTALVVGEYGSATDQPQHVEIVGNVLSKDHSVNFYGASARVTPLEKGPSLVWAERIPPTEWDLGRAATRLPWGGGSGCPVGTKQVVRATWDGGIKKRNGDDADMDIGVLYEVTVLGSQGSSRVVKPVALADLGDGDNNHSLCLDVSDPAISIRFPNGHLTDPRNDINVDTAIQVSNAGR